MKSAALTSRDSTAKRRRHAEADFRAATLNVTTALADDLLSAGFGKLNVDDLFSGNFQN